MTCIQNIKIVILRRKSLNFQIVLFWIYSLARELCQFILYIKNFIKNIPDTSNQTFHKFLYHNPKQWIIISVRWLQYSLSNKVSSNLIVLCEQIDIINHFSHGGRRSFIVFYVITCYTLRNISYSFKDFFL